MSRVVDEIVEEALRELSDESVQRELWLAAGGSEVSSFTECISHLWDDSGLAEALDHPSAVIYTPQIDDRLRHLRQLLGRVDEGRSPRDILADPQLEESRAAAQQLLTDLREFGSSYA